MSVLCVYFVRHVCCMCCAVCVVSAVFVGVLWLLCVLCVVYRVRVMCVRVCVCMVLHLYARFNIFLHIYTYMHSY